jgi:hypothetical protein
LNSAYEQEGQISWENHAAREGLQLMRTSAVRRN